jgi:hypothetical protein
LQCSFRHGLWLTGHGFHLVRSCLTSFDGNREHLVEDFLGGDHDLFQLLVFFGRFIYAKAEHILYIADLVIEFFEHCEKLVALLCIQIAIFHIGLGFVLDDRKRTAKLGDERGRPIASLKTDAFVKFRLDFLYRCGTSLGVRPLI